MQHVDAEMAELGHLSPTVARVVQPVMPEPSPCPLDSSIDGPTALS
jgi:hypothetical protein